TQRGVRAFNLYCVTNNSAADRHVLARKPPRFWQKVAHHFLEWLAYIWLAQQFTHIRQMPQIAAVAQQPLRAIQPFLMRKLEPIEIVWPQRYEVWQVADSRER